MREHYYLLTQQNISSAFKQVHLPGGDIVRTSWRRSRDNRPYDYYQQFNYYGMRGIATGWIKSYRMSRKQLVNVVVCMLCNMWSSGVYFRSNTSGPLWQRYMQRIKPCTVHTYRK